MSSATEDYLKRIYSITEMTGSPVASLGVIAERMGVTRGTVTSMMKTLAEAGFVDYIPRSGASLTAAGTAEALTVIRKHRLVELFLVAVLGLDWSEVHDEAERLEHAISDRVLERIDLLLERPRADPHGDPIPTATGDVRRLVTSGLDRIDCPARGTIARVSHDSPEFLSYVSTQGLEPGSRIHVLERDEIADTVTVETGGNRVVLGSAAAANIEVELEPQRDRRSV